MLEESFDEEAKERAPDGKKKAARDDYSSSSSGKERRRAQHTLTADDNFTDGEDYAGLDTCSLIEDD